MKVSDWKHIADAMADDFTDLIFEGKGYKIYSTHERSIDFMDGNMIEYLLGKIEGQDDEEAGRLMDELTYWSFSELERFLPKSAKFVHETILDYMITGLSGSSVFYSVSRIFNHWYLICQGDEWVDDIYRIRFEKKPCYITEFVFEYFVTDRHAGKIIPSCDLEPIWMHGRFVERKMFKTLLKSYLNAFFSTRGGTHSFMKSATEALDGVLAQKLFPILPEEMHSWVIRFKENPELLRSNDREVQIQMGKIWIEALTSDYQEGA